MATKTGVPRTRAVRMRTAIGQPAEAIRSGKRPRAKARGTAARAITPPEPALRGAPGEAQGHEAESAPA